MVSVADPDRLSRGISVISLDNTCQRVRFSHLPFWPPLTLQQQPGSRVPSSQSAPVVDLTSSDSDDEDMKPRIDLTGKFFLLVRFVLSNNCGYNTDSDDDEKRATMDLVHASASASRAVGSARASRADPPFVEGLSFAALEQRTSVVLVCWIALAVPSFALRLHRLPWPVPSRQSSVVSRLTVKIPAMIASWCASSSSSWW